MYARLVAIGGCMGSGKTHLALSLQESFVKLGYSATILHFATPLKNAARELFMFSEDQLEGFGKDNYDARWRRAPREIMQALGTDYCRNVLREDFFIEHMKQQLSNVRTDIAIIGDMRFENEAKFVSNCNGITIKLPDGYDYEYRSHQSETSLPDHAVDIVMLLYPNVQEIDALACSVLERKSKNK